MKKLIYLIAGVVLLASCGNSKKESSEIKVISDGLRFSESVWIDGDRLIVPSFGTEELDPLNNEGKGYISVIKDTVVTKLIPADGTLSAPKGTLVQNDRLFVADVGKLVIYDMNALSDAPQIIAFPGNNIYLNDLATDGNNLYITVTNTGNIFTLDILHPIDASSLTFYTNIPGANGIIIKGKMMYVASYPPDGVTTDENVMYRIENIDNPEITRLFNKPGQYDGLALNNDGSRLYYTNWVGGEIGYYDFQTEKIVPLDLGIKFAGPARIAFKDGKLYIPDLPNSKVVIYPVE